MWKNGSFQNSIDKPFQFYTSIDNCIPRRKECVFDQINAYK